MKKSDPRDSIVPRGTFASSAPPPPSDELAAKPTAGEGGVEAQRRRYTSTLLGHPVAAPVAGNAPPVPPTEATHAVLSPPKWRGAQAYQEGEEPQPRVSAISQPAASEPAATTIGRIEPRKVFVPAREREIGDAIEELFESQAQLGRAPARDSAPELPLDDVLEAFDVKDEADEAPPPPPASARPAPPPPPPPRDAVSEEVAAEAEPARQSEPAVPALASPPSSLSPSELARPRPRPDASPRMGLLMVGAIVLVGGGFWALTRGSYPGPPRDIPAPPKAAAAAESSSSPAPAPAAPAKPFAPEAASRPSEPATPAAEPSAQSAAPRKARSAREAPRRARREASRDLTASEPSEAAPRTPSTSAEQPSGEQGAILKVTPRGAEQALPETPSRDDVLAALDPIRDDVRRCAPGRGGVAEVDITVDASGAVTHAVVGGDFAGTPEGSCIARAVRSATFRPFSKPRFRVIYPFSL